MLDIFKPPIQQTKKVAPRVIADPVSDGRSSIKQEAAPTVHDCQNAFVRKRRNVHNDPLGGTIENGVPVRFLAPAFHILHSFQFWIIAVGFWVIFCP